MKTIIILIFLVSIQISNSQPSITWNKIYDGPQHSNDGGVSICHSDNGNYFVFGYTAGGVFILKINEYGDTLWTKVFSAINDAFTSISTENDGGCIFAGNSSSSTLIKMDVNGNVVWTKNYLSERVYIYDIRKTSDGYICCGLRWGIFDGYVLKVKFDGTLVWEKIFPASLFKEFFSIDLTDDSGYMVSGYNADFQGDIPKALIMKLDSSGNMKWEKKYMIKNSGASGKYIVKTNSDYMVMGGTEENINGDYQERIFMMRLDKNGDSLFTKRFPYNKHDGYTGSKIINDNRFVLSSFVYTTKVLDSIAGKNMIVDSLGNIIYQREYISPRYLHYNSCIPLTNGDIIFTGLIKNYSHDIYEDLIITRTDS